MARFSTIAILAAVCALLWWYHDLCVTYRLFDGVLASALDMVATLTTAALGVVAASELIIVVGFTIITVSKPTGFERASIYASLCIVAFALVLGHFGVAITTVLATSAVLTAIIGLALQPTLGALIAGLTLSADRMLKIGDGIVQGGEALTVAEIGWRSVSATRGDGSRILLSNARILDGGFEILPGGRSLRVETILTGPLACEPQRIADMLRPTIADIAGIDVSRSISVTPSLIDAEKAQARYRLRYWLRDYARRAEIEEEILKRSWYVLQRHDVKWPVALNFLAEYNARAPSLDAPGWRRRLAAALVEAGRSPEGAPVKDLSIESAVGSGILLLYGDGERIVMPDRVEGHHCLLIGGALRKIMFEFAGDRRPNVHSVIDSRFADLQKLSARLAERIGPYAEFAVHQAARNEPSLAAIQRIVAEEITDTKERSRFLALVERSSDDEVRQPGVLLSLSRGATQELQADTLFRALGRVAIVAIPPEILEQPDLGLLGPSHAAS